MNLGDGEKLSDELHADDELFVQLQRLLALFTTHWEILGYQPTHKQTDRVTMYCWDWL